jgi:hypothetical protein
LSESDSNPWSTKRQADPRDPGGCRRRGYDQIAAKTGKSAAYIAKRLRLLDLIPPVAEAFSAGHIAIEHALLIAKLAADVQEKAFTHCFDISRWSHPC